MQTRHLLAVSLTLVATFVSTVTFAQTTTPPSPSEARQARIDAREANQQKRIDAGKASGQLNDKEAARMQKRQDRIAKMEANAQKDGKISAGEAKRIETAQNKASRRIYKEKHDAQTK